MLWQKTRIDLSKTKYFVFIGARLYGFVASGASLANFAGNLNLDHVLVFAECGKITTSRKLLLKLVVRSGAYTVSSQLAVFKSFVFISDTDKFRCEVALFLA